MLRSHTIHNPLDETMSHCRFQESFFNQPKPCKMAAAPILQQAAWPIPVEKKRARIKEVIHDRRLGLNWEGLLDGCRTGVNPSPRVSSNPSPDHRRLSSNLQWRSLTSRGSHTANLPVDREESLEHDALQTREAP